MWSPVCDVFKKEFTNKEWFDKSERREKNMNSDIYMYIFGCVCVLAITYMVTHE